MPSAENALLQFEAGQELNAYAAMTIATDNRTGTLSGTTLWSSRAGYGPTIRPNGLLTSGVLVTPAASEDDNKVDVAALTCYLAGVSTSVSAGVDKSITRPATAVSKICSITINSSAAIAVVVGTDGATTAFSETRGAAGGPPWIPTGSIEIAQVRVATNTAGPITAAEIFQTIGTHKEMATYPTWSTYPIGDDDHLAAYVLFDATMPEIHSDDAGVTSYTKKVYAEVYEPIFSTVSIASDFIPPGETRSVSSAQFYGKTVGSSSKTLQQGRFTAALEDGITDALAEYDGEVLTFRFYPDRDRSPNFLCQGYLALALSYPASDTITAACTISSSQKAVRRSA